MALKGKILLFGKTGDGKSTVANVLVTGSIENAPFKIGHELKGCTSELETLTGNGWTVTDTIGLGEGESGTVPNEVAETRIVNFLRKVSSPEGYSHIIFVKSATNRFDTLDEKIWKVFKRVFKGAEDAFTILFTKGDQDWLDKNWQVLPEWVKNCGRKNVLITNIPPTSSRPMREKKNEAIRQAASSRLERDLTCSLEARGGKWATPDISNMADEQIRDEGRSILKFIERLGRVILKGISVFGTGVNAIASLISMFS